LDLLPSYAQRITFWSDVLNPADPWRRRRYEQAVKILESTDRFTTGKVPDWSDAKEVFETAGSPYPSGIVDRLRVKHGL
jgi:hypothetical protein